MAGLSRRAVFAAVPAATMALAPSVVLTMPVGDVPWHFHRGWKFARDASLTGLPLVEALLGRAKWLAEHGHDPVTLHNTLMAMQGAITFVDEALPVPPSDLCFD